LRETAFLVEPYSICLGIDYYKPTPDRGAHEGFGLSKGELHKRSSEIVATIAAVDRQPRDLYGRVVVVEVLKSFVRHQGCSVIVSNDLSAHEGHICDQLTDLGSEYAVRSRQALLFVCVRVALSECFEGSVAVTQLQPSEPVTGLNLSNGDI